jgi:hypothetical protein
MISKIVRIFFRYFIIGLLGTFVIATVVSFVQIALVKKRISQVEGLIREKQPDVALSRLIQVELWATRYPALAVELRLAEIPCYAKMRDFVSAQETAAKIYNRKYASARRSLTPAEYLQDIPNFLINLLYQGNHTIWAGYDKAIDAFRQSGEYGQLVALCKEVLALQPNGPLAPKVKPYIPVPASAQPQPTAQAAGTQPPAQPAVPEKPDHRKMLAKYMAQQDWDNALKECEIILDDMPDDQAVLQQRRLAMVKGMRWGIVIAANTPTYDTSGKFLRNTPAGTVVEITNIVKTARDDLALCLPQKGSTDGVNTLIRACDLQINLGDLSKVDEDELKLRSKEIKLTIDMQELRNKLLATTIDDQNPHAAEYKKAKKDHEEYWAKVRDLQRKRDASTGDEMMRYSDTLRQMKGEDVRLATALDGAKQKYDHARRTQMSSIKSPELQAMESELATIKERLNSMRK